MDLHPGLLEQAQANSRTLTDAAFLMGLAREIALARGPELTLAYRSVVMVQPGFRKSREADVEHSLQREPCVIFVVRRKWLGGQHAAGDAQCLPRWLVTFAEHDGQRLPFALATDVQEASGFSGAQAHGAAAMWLQPPGLEWERGAACCAVQFDSDEGSQLCLLSAEHVLSPCVDVEGLAATEHLPARPLDVQGARLQAPQVASSLAVAGVLRGDENPSRPSFDVQLARIDNLAAARATLGAQRLNAGEPWVRTPERMWQLGAKRWFHLMVPDNNGTQVRGPLQARLEAPLALPFALDYRLRRGNAIARVLVYHDELLKLQLSAPPFAMSGDSGCALVVLQSDGTVTLAGLYIGGSGDAAYAIPAWQLFDLRRWWNFPPGTRMTPVSI